MKLMSIPAFKGLQKQALIRNNYNEIYAHELAHKRAAGSLAGPIVIEKNSEGIPIGGHVSIQMPTLNRANPEETIKQADIVIKSAKAPADPSSQDFKVAHQAEAIKAKAEELKNHKR